MDDFKNDEGVNLYKSPEQGNSEVQGTSFAQTPQTPVQPNQFGGPGVNSYNTPDMNQNQGGSGSKGLSIASMVCGIVSILGFCCCTPIGIICGLAGVILGIVSKTKNMDGQGMALAGIITGAVGIVGSIIWIIVGGAFTESLQEELGLYSSVFSMFM